tara:strand:+ start:283 stop:936 length:654 start_codon:yes stop_codon:yes gene_type:complete
VRRISIRGSLFSAIEDGVRTSLFNADFVDLVIVDAASISRVYYAGEYEQNVQKPPTCWSIDNQRPAQGVPKQDQQALRCLDCTHNIRGSGRNRGRACKFIQHLAVAFDGQLDKVYRLKLPATSIYGKTQRGHMPMQQYVNFLSSRGSKASCILTRVYFDELSNIPKLFFKPVRSLTEEEKSTVEETSSHISTRMVTSFIVEHSSPFKELSGFEINAT